MKTGRGKYFPPKILTRSFSLKDEDQTTAFFIIRLWVFPFVFCQNQFPQIYWSHKGKLRSYEKSTNSKFIYFSNVR